MVFLKKINIIKEYLITFLTDWSTNFSFFCFVMKSVGIGEKKFVLKVPVQTSDAQTSDQYKRQTSTNVGLVQTSDWYKRRTSTNVGRVHL